MGSALFNFAQTLNRCTALFLKPDDSIDVRLLLLQLIMVKQVSIIMYIIYFIVVRCSVNVLHCMCV